MANKDFSFDEKLKYIELNINFDIDVAVLNFVCDYEQRYREQWLRKNRNFKDTKMFWYAKLLISKWTEKYYNNDMKEFSSLKGKNKIKKRKYTINDLTENDREIYQEIMEKIISDRGVDPKTIIDEIKRIKKERNIENSQRLCSVFGVNRSSIYNQLILKKVKEFDFKKYEIEGLNEWILEEFFKSDGVIGRDKLYQKHRKMAKKPVSSYVFRLHYEHLNIKSRAYIRKTRKYPKEEKYKGVWAEDLLNGNFNSKHFGDEIHADIKYIKINGKWHYLHVIIDSHSKLVLGFEIQSTRTAKDTINLVKKVIETHEITPKIFHSDHGIEYSNNEFKNFLTLNEIKQSMSPKGYSLGNRPSEFFFANIQREKFDFYNLNMLDFASALKIVQEYIDWYNYERPQSCLEYKTPGTFLNYPGVIVDNIMCLDFVS